MTKTSLFPALAILELYANIFSMTNLQKFILFWLGAAFSVILSLFLLVSINQKLNAAATTNTVSFSGEGKVVTKPDVALVYLSIVTEAATSKAAQEDNSKRSRQVVDYLKKQGIDDKDVKTVGYNIYPQYTYYPQNIYEKSRPPRISGYQVNQTLEVKIRDLDKVSSVLDSVVEAGANQINSFSFQIDDPEKFKNEARELAIKNAKAKASELKNQLDIRLGRIVNFSEGFGGVPPPIFYKGSEAGGGYGGGGPEVPVGENEVRVEVTITSQIR